MVPPPPFLKAVDLLSTWLLHLRKYKFEVNSVVRS